MGDLNVSSIHNRKELQDFVRCLLKEIHALDVMIKGGWFETGITRIGAEQEMCMIDRNWKPNPQNLKALELINNKMYTTELAMFNLEANMDPLEFTGNALSKLHEDLKGILEVASEKVKSLNGEILLAGILPTIRKFDVEIEQVTPLERYRALMETIHELRGGTYELRIKGMDELNLKLDSAMMEACNTSFQVHLQVHPDEFARKYNYAQALAGPVMAAAVNSPVLFGRRLWKETRIALFQQAIDIRTFSQHLRDRSPRVTFGNHWLNESIIEIYKDDIARFKVILSTDAIEDVFEKINEGITPKLRALNIHNSTVYRWNRPCYGISPNGQPHLRIENRVLPSGPSIPDEIANAAFWLGLMNGFEDECYDVREVMNFDDAKNNFFAAARFGLDTRFTWFNEEKIEAHNLIIDRLLPMAKNGLQKAGIDQGDIDYYLGIIEARTNSGRTGSDWILRSFSSLAKNDITRDEISATLTAAIYKNQQLGKPVHEWELAHTEDLEYEPSSLLVEEFMSTDLITVQEDDILDLVANLMDWRRIRHLPVEDKEGKLVGLVTARMALRHFADRNLSQQDWNNATVKSIMIKNPVTITPETQIVEAMQIMRENKYGSLPVVKGGHLVGIITETDFLNITNSLLKRLARKNS